MSRFAFLARVLARQLVYRLRYGAGAPRYAERLWINPQQVMGIDARQRKALRWTRRSSGQLVDAWPSDRVQPIADHPKIRFCLAHWQQGLSWEDAGAVAYYQQKGSMSESALRERLQRLDTIFNTVRAEGRLRSMQELNAGNWREEGGVRINIGPQGELVFFDGGTHRLAMALALGFTIIPAQLGVVHRDGLSALAQLRQGAS